MLTYVVLVPWWKKWTLTQNKTILLQWNVFKKIVCKMVAILFDLDMLKLVIIFTTEHISSTLFGSGSIGQIIICLDWRALSMYEMGTRINMYQPLFLFWGQPNPTRNTGQSAVCNLSFCGFRIRQRLTIWGGGYWSNDIHSSFPPLSTMIKIGLPMKYQLHHYSDVKMGAMVYQITSLTIVYSTVYSGTDQRKHQKKTSLVS